jgi:protein gp37
MFKIIKKIISPTIESIKTGLSEVGGKIWLRSKTAIAWTDVTFNVVWGCTKVSAGCKNCYAANFAHAQGFGGPSKKRPFIWGKSGDTASGKGWVVEQGRRVFPEKYWSKLLEWNARARKNNQIVTVFISSMTDVFEDHPITRRELEKFWAIVRQTPWLHYQILTKRAGNIRSCLPADWFGFDNGYPNVWLGVTVENQAVANRFDNILANIPATVRFISYEPAIGPLRIERMDKLDWLIAGGESGPNRRPFDHDWARDIHRDCEANDVAFFYKQDTAFRSSTNPYLDGVKHYNFPMPRESKSRVAQAA